MSDMMIEMTDLVKKFPHTNEAQEKSWKIAVAGVSLSVGAGEVFDGFILAEDDGFEVALQGFELVAVVLVDAFFGDAGDAGDEFFA